LAEVDFTQASKEILAQGSEASHAFRAACEEWKLLMATALSALAREAVRLASAYACEREAFGRAIGTYQAISHPLADSIVDIDGAKYLTWKAIHDIEVGLDCAAAEVSLALWWAVESAGHAVTRALHTFGGYGLALEYDVHLYNLRAKQWPLVAGDHNALLAEAGRRLYAGESAVLPDVGAVTIDFDRGEQARAMAEELEAFFERNLTPE
jgi:alkylation response protein AidB-like acyl-CoA dehydrogenase